MRQRLLERLLDIQRAISHRVPLPEVLAAITEGASACSAAAPSRSSCTDALDPERPIVAGVDSGRARQIAAPVHVNGAPPASSWPRRRTGPARPRPARDARRLRRARSLALTDARTVEAMQRGLPRPAHRPAQPRAVPRPPAARARRRRAPRHESCVLFVDLDGFKAVNDSLGHAAGDELLRAAAARLRSCTARRRHRRPPRRRRVRAAARGRVERAGAGRSPSGSSGDARPFPIEGRDVFIGASVGIAPADGARRGADELLRNADLAMYAPRRTARGRAATFEPRCTPRCSARIELEADLRRAVSARRAASPTSRRRPRHRPTRAVEALARWRHPTGADPAADFIPLAEEIGVIGELGRWVLARRAGSWPRGGDRRPT